MSLSTTRNEITLFKLFYEWSRFIIYILISLSYKPDTFIDEIGIAKTLLIISGSETGHDE